MKNQFMKRVLAVMLASAMTVTLFTGCGSTESTETQTGQSSAAQNTEAQATATGEAQKSETVPETTFEHDPVLNDLGAEPFVKEEVTITIGLAQNANIEDYDTNYYTTMLEEVSGVNVEFMLFPSGENQDKLQMMVMGDETLPDIILWGLDTALAQQWGTEGYLIPLEEYFANSSIYALEGYTRVLDQSGLDILDYQTTADGHIWAFPSYQETTTNPTYNRTWVYGPWLEALNLELPKTTEEFADMLRAFKTQDPNGNGKADEIPMIGSEIAAGGVGSFFWEFVMNAFTPSSIRMNGLVSTDGKLSVSFATDQWKQGVKFLNSLVTEGLVDPVSFTQDANTFKQMLNISGDQMVGCFTYISPSFIGADHPSKQAWVLLEPLTGPEGMCSTAYKADLPSNTAYITADCKHPEVAFRLLDLMCREDFTITNRWGKQGENWDYVEDIKGNPAFADKDFSGTWMGYPAYFYEYNSVWNQPGNVHWMNTAVRFRTAEIASGYYACSLDPELDAANYQLALKLGAYEAVKPAEPITQIKYETPELQAEANLMIADIKSYMFESMANWCLGVSDVEAEWDTYLSELEARGLSEWLEIQQAGWK